MTLCLATVTLFAVSSCDKSEIPPTVCYFDNPLTDLLWLKSKVDEITLIIQSGNPLSVSIYQCIYGNNEIGFLIDEGNTKPFYNCNGEILCTMGGFAGETCSELNIVSQKLIWEINNNDMNNLCEFGNPLTDLPWLKAKVDEITLLLQNNLPFPVAIYQCSYSDGKICFLEDRNIVKFYYDCEGQGLCMEGGIAGETCPEELKIDYKNKKLIWKP